MNSMEVKQQSKVIFWESVFLRCLDNKKTVKQAAKAANDATEARKNVDKG